MRFKLDENLPVSLKSLFTSADYACDTVDDEDLSGAEDSHLYSRCQAEQRVFITLDMDFSDIRTYPPAEGQGVIVLRPVHQDTSAINNLAEHIVQSLKEESPIRRLWIVEPQRIRIRE